MTAAVTGLLGRLDALLLPLDVACERGARRAWRALKPWAALALWAGHRVLAAAAGGLERRARLLTPKPRQEEAPRWVQRPVWARSWWAVADFGGGRTAGRAETAETAETAAQRALEHFGQGVQRLVVVHRQGLQVVERREYAGRELRWLGRHP